MHLKLFTKRCNRTKLKAADITLIALMVAVIEVSKAVLANIPNVELTSFWIILFTLYFGSRIFYAIPVFILIEGAMYGFGLWWVMYLYAWPLLAAFTHALSRADSPLLWAVVSGAFGLCFGLLCAVPYFFIGFISGGAMQGLRQMFAWWVAGIPFDLIHGASNFAIMLALYRPISDLLRRMPQIVSR